MNMLINLIVAIPSQSIHIQMITLYNLNIHDFIFGLYLKKAEKS